MTEWKAVLDISDDKGLYSVIDSNLGAITGWGNVRQTKEQAHLIAAAPALLAACKAILVFVFLTGDKDHEYYYQAEIRQLRAAIAKAEGTES